MKSEAEIREHRNALRTLIASPCRCRGTIHEEKCRMGNFLMNTIAKHFDWILGEYEDFQPIVDKYNAAAAEIREGN
jgi:hypothetical protein